MSDAHLSKELGIQFRNPHLLTEALTHRSFLNENRNWHVGNNERLEFLGDAVLELVISEFLYSLFPSLQEGELTALRSKLVRNETLFRVGDDLSLYERLNLSRGQRNDNSSRVKERLVACAVEALIGAIYLDQGLEAVRSFVNQRLIKYLEQLLSQDSDAKSRFQEEAQRHDRITPTYHLLSESGLDHEKVFIVGVFLGSTMIAKGNGPAKRLAEEEAANEALRIKGWK